MAGELAPAASVAFRNPYRGRQRALLVGGCACLLMAIVAGGLVGSGRFDTNQGVGTFIAVSLVLGIVATFVSLFLALVMSFVARATDRVFEQFRRGDLLADWSYPSQEWESFVAVEQAGDAKRIWGIPIFIVVPAGLVLVIVAVALASGGAILTRNLLLAAAGDAALYWALTRVGAAISRRRLAALRRSPRVMVGQDAIYCGGVLTQWNYGGTLLQSVRTIAGTPLRLEVMTGAGTKPNAGKYDFTSLLLIPVPLGREDEAARIVQALRPSG